MKRETDVEKSNTFKFNHFLRRLLIRTFDGRLHKLYNSLICHDRYYFRILWNYKTF